MGWKSFQEDMEAKWFGKNVYEPFSSRIFRVSNSHAPGDSVTTLRHPEHYWSLCIPKASHLCWFCEKPSREGS